MAARRHRHGHPRQRRDPEQPRPGQPRPGDGRDARPTSTTSTSRRVDTTCRPTRWYGGWLGEEAGQVQRLNKDNYELFTAGGIDFLIIHLEIDMPTFAVQWADEIIDRYPDRQVILSTHAFVNTSNARPTSRVTTRADGLSAAQVWTQLVEPNCNVFMVVNGHYPGEGRLTSTNNVRPARPPGPDRLPEPRQRRRRLAALLQVPAEPQYDRGIHVLAASSARSRTTRPASSTFPTT